MPVRIERNGAALRRRNFSCEVEALSGEFSLPCHFRVLREGKICLICTEDPKPNLFDTIDGSLDRVGLEIHGGLPSPWLEEPEPEAMVELEMVVTA